MIHFNRALIDMFGAVSWYLKHWGRDKMAAISHFAEWKGSNFHSKLTEIWFFPKGQIKNKSTLVQIMVWRWSADIHYLNQCWSILMTHICVTRPPRWVNICLLTALLTWFSSSICFNCHLGFAVKRAIIGNSRNYIFIVDYEFTNNYFWNSIEMSILLHYRLSIVDNFCDPC